MVRYNQVILNAKTNKNFNILFLREFNKIFFVVLLSVFFFRFYFNYSLVDLLFYFAYWTIFLIIITLLINYFERNINPKIKQNTAVFVILLNSLLFLSLIGLSSILGSLHFLNENIATFLTYLTFSFLFIYSKLDLQIFSNYLIYYLFSKILNPYLIYFFVFVTLRIWFYTDIPVVGVHPDSGSYFAPVVELSAFFSNLQQFNLRDLDWPSFKLRSPGYPIFLFIAYTIYDSHLFAVFLQMFVALSSGLILLRIISNYSKSTSLVLSILLSLHFSKNQSILYETSILTESLYSSLILLFFGCLFGAIVFGTKKYLIFISLVTAALVLTKPGSVNYLFVIILLSILLAYTKQNKLIVVQILLPFTIVMIALGFYNKIDYGNFSNTNSGSQEISLVTNLIWQTDVDYPDDINQAIVESQKLIHQRISVEQLQVLNKSWDYSEIFPLYLAGHFYGPASEIAKVTDGYGNPEWNRWVSKISSDSIKKNPVYFLKHYLVMMRYNFRLPDIYDSNILISDLLNRVRVYSFDKHFSTQRTDIDSGTKDFMIKLGKEYSNPNYLPGKISTLPETREVLIGGQTKFLDVYNNYSLIFEKPLNMVLWIYIALISVFLVLLRFVFQGMINKLGVFVVFSSLVVFSNYSIVALAEYSIPRYTYPYEFLYILIPVVFVKSYLDEINYEIQ